MKLNISENKPKEAAEFFKAKMTFTTGPMELDRMISEGNKDINIIDVRAMEDYERGHIPGALNLPREEWKHRTGIKIDKINIFYCYSHVCHMAASAALEFAEIGYSVMELDGGFDSWSEYKLDIER